MRGDKNKTVMVTGAAGYIGSHTCVELLEAGFSVVAVDNLCNSSRKSLERVERITGKPIVFHELDIRDGNGMKKVFEQSRIDAIIHFAGLKAVGESVAEPLRYYDNNVAGTVSLLQSAREAGVRYFVFSSSATVYGDPDYSPVPETAGLSVANPYGRSKLMIEEMLNDLSFSDSSWSVAILRYFNPVGAHPSGMIGEDPHGIPNNLMPYVAQVAVGKLKELAVFGDDYPTKDGTGVRDYIHVMDLARGHVDALAYLFENNRGFTVNLGTGIGYSVLDVVHAFEKACGRPVPYRMAPRRAGDVPLYYADPSLAFSLLGWKAKYGLDEMCEDYWRWQSKNPDGYV